MAYFNLPDIVIRRLMVAFVKSWQKSQDCLINATESKRLAERCLQRTCK